MAGLFWCKLVVVLCGGNAMAAAMFHLLEIEACFVTMKACFVTVEACFMSAAARWTWVVDGQHSHVLVLWGRIVGQLGGVVTVFKGHRAP